ncbi:MAG: NAD(P)-dependent glycerol-3-phosphate dehydrogenase [Nitrospinaceae bacterium]|jgi:glycerol-3-phosphate dehydrogenase (NAD(P)+)|nr:MAG: NAD(P)-dependent glycerol-3-phosphate dehydrogenase [Nitrospinaceae bacterium]
MTITKIGIIGAGSWGTALALHLSRIGIAVNLWVYEADLCETLRKTGENSVFLPGHRLPESVRPTRSLEEAASGQAAVLLVVPSHVMRETAAKLKPFLARDALIISASKGLENETHCTIHTILSETLGAGRRHVALSGPTFAAEIARQAPSALVAAADDLDTAQFAQELFASPQLKVFTSTDIRGVEIGGALKNAIAIATGISDGLELGYNARAALITRGLVEISRIGTALGARPETFYGLSGLGDLVLTCTGDLSRNRTVGLRLGRGERLDDIVGHMRTVAEGVRTVKSAFALKNRYDIQASIIEETYRILYENKSPQHALEDVMKVEISTEFSGVKGLE